MEITKHYDRFPISIGGGTYYGHLYTEDPQESARRIKNYVDGVYEVDWKIHHAKTW